MVLLTCITGCALFSRTPEQVVVDRPESSMLGKLPDRMTRDSLRLEILLIDRPAGDPLLTEMLWDEVDEIGAVDLDVRHALNANGMRVGVAGSTLPAGLQKIIKENRQGMSFSPQDESRISHKPIVDLLEGTDTLITSANAHAERVVLNLSKDETQSFENAQCMFRVTGERMQDGWARLIFVPEVHHGQTAVRHQANELGWEMKTSQKVEPYYDQKFDVSLNVGEIAVISLSNAPENSLGDHFFASADGRNHRLLVVRLAGMETLQGISARVTGQLKSMK